MINDFKKNLKMNKIHVVLLQYGHHLGHVGLNHRK